MNFTPESGRQLFPIPVHPTPIRRLVRRPDDRHDRDANTITVPLET